MAPRGTFQYVVFPRSKKSPPWRRTLTDIQTQADSLLAEIGGWPTI